MCGPAVRLPFIPQNDMEIKSNKEDIERMLMAISQPHVKVRFPCQATPCAKTRGQTVVRCPRPGYG